MNELTHRLVSDAASKYKSAAAKNDAEFHFIVYNAYCDHIVDVVASELMLRACRLWRAFHPEHFDEDGFLLDYEACIYDIELRLSDMVMRMAWRIVERTPSLKLDDWNAIPQASVQLRLF